MIAGMSEMLDRNNILLFVGSVLPEHHGPKGGTNIPQTDNSTTKNSPIPPGAGINKDDSFTEIYMIIVIILSTLLPLICVILSAVFGRKIWVKFHDTPSPLENATQASIKSTRSKSISRKSTRNDSRVSKTDPNSRDKLIQKDDLIDDTLDDPVIIVEDISVPSTSQENTQPILDLDDDGGFASARSSFRNHSLKVEGVGSPHRTNHHRSHSDAGRNRRKSEVPDAKEFEISELESQNQARRPSTSGDFLTTPVTKIRKSHSMRYRTPEVNEGSRSRVAQDDCMGNLKRPNFDSELMKKSPRLSQRRSPHYFHQEEHQPQVHQQQSHAGHTSHSVHHSSHSSQHSHINKQSSHRASISGHHSTQASHRSSHSGHHTSQSSHHPGQSGHHSVNLQQGQTSHQQSQHGSHSRHYSMRRKDDFPAPILPQPELVTIGTDVDAATLDAMADEIVDMLVQEEEEAANFGITTSDLSIEDTGPTNPSYQYGNQPSNKYPLTYHGGAVYPVTTSYPSTESRTRRLHVTAHQISGTSPPLEEDKPPPSRKKSLPNDFDYAPPEIQPMPVLSPRGLLNKQQSLPVVAKNVPRQIRGTRQRLHGSLRQDPAPQRLFDQSYRRSSTRERTSSGGFVAKRTTSNGDQRMFSRNSGSFNLGTISSRSPIPPSMERTVSPRDRLSVGGRIRNTPSPRPMTDDEIQHI